MSEEGVSHRHGEGNPEFGTSDGGSCHCSEASDFGITGFVQNPAPAL